MKYILLIFLFISNTPIYAQQVQDSSKRRDNLFHPTPKKFMRDFATDRPDVTESAYTVDAGHFQLETDLFKTERYHLNGTKTFNNSYNAANLKLGITQTLDVQVVVNTLSVSKFKNGNYTSNESGFGGFTLRTKKNLWGNDNGKSALSVLPFIDIPTTAGRKVSGGIVFPFALALPHDWDFGSQIETDFERNETGKNYHLNFLASVTTSHSLLKDMDFFVEGVITKDGETSTYEYFINGGPVYSLSGNVNIDCGVYYGLKKISSKTYFIGLSFRI
ncbi:MAG: transporter [Ginsengibacter sp.]